MGEPSEDDLSLIGRYKSSFAATAVQPQQSVSHAETQNTSNKMTASSISKRKNSGGNNKDSFDGSDAASLAICEENIAASQVERFLQPLLFQATLVSVPICFRVAVFSAETWSPSTLGIV